ncbi:MAG: S-layer protein, partial [Nanoarchaeota archaeon]
RANNELGINTSAVQLWNSTDELFDSRGKIVVFLREPDVNEDHDIGLTDYGAYIDLFDPSTSGQDAETLTLEYPLSQRGAEVFVVMGESSRTKTKGGEICTVANISPRTLLDTEVGSRVQDYNLILVGGPCASDTVAKIDAFPACSEWPYQPGEAVIWLAENGDNVALLVAGTEALDTRMAAKVLANHEDYDLSGEKVMVSGTLSSPKVASE